MNRIAFYGKCRMMDECREAFEKWSIEQGWEISGPDARMRWATWQGARSSGTPSAPVSLEKCRIALLNAWIHFVDTGTNEEETSRILTCAALNAAGVHYAALNTMGDAVSSGKEHPVTGGHGLKSHTGYAPKTKETSPAPAVGDSFNYRAVSSCDPEFAARDKQRLEIGKPLGPLMASSAPWTAHHGGQCRYISVEIYDNEIRYAGKTIYKGDVRGKSQEEIEAIIQEYRIVKPGGEA